MSTIDLIRYWKDPEYRESLNELQLANLPESPAGLIELGDADLENVVAGAPTRTIGCPSPWNLIGF